jgi:RNA polymerase sigma-70 factor (ECF subfamily)
VDGAGPALALVVALGARGDLDEYHLFHATRADLLRRLGRTTGAATAYTRAIALASNDVERRFLERRLREVRSAGSSV